MNGSFQVGSKVKLINDSDVVYEVKLVRFHNNGYVYTLTVEGSHSPFLAFHEELEQYINIESGDMVSYLGHYYTVSHTIHDNNIVLKVIKEIVSLKDVVLITRATRSELLNAMHNLYGGTIQNLNSDSIKMGVVKELYGDLIFKKILSNRSKY